MRMPKFGTIAATAAVGLLSVALISGPASANRAKPPAEAVELAKANNKFGVDMFKKLHKDGENTFMSPASIAIALQMCAEGAEGETKSELHKAMHVTGKDVKGGNKSLLKELGSRKGVTLSIANSLWADPARVTMNEKYVSDVREYFDSEARTASFSDPATLTAINSWISEKTNALIPKMLEDISDETVVYLINAIYFKGEWTVKFDKAATKDADFNMADGTKKTVRMMSRDAEMQYGNHDGIQIIKLPYGKDKQTAMWVALPAADKSLDSVIASMNAETLSTWQRATHQQDGTFKMPRFTTKFTAPLNEPLKELGVVRAFNEATAEFDPMGKSLRDPLHISRVLHEAVVIVTEEGTEAAAVTIVDSEGNSAPPPPFNMTCDRPFFFWIADQRTGAVLFAGTVYNPENPK